VPTTLTHLNTCPAEEFVSLVGPVFERSPWVAESVAAERPFASREALHAALCRSVRESAETRQVALIRAHPDLVGRAVLTAESAREQAAAGLGDLTSEEVARFDRYNRDYKARFGFPFVICARHNKKDTILRALPDRLTHTRATELATALDEIFQIAALRLADLLPESANTEPALSL
jgi:2-oxo-4-hydroxy-4-carboxy-5-ureidoimidazoline decarboxylase